jgi:hypothetical protein
MLLKARYKVTAWRDGAEAAAALGNPTPPALYETPFAARCVATSRTPQKQCHTNHSHHNNELLCDDLW